MIERALLTRARALEGKCEADLMLREEGSPFLARGCLLYTSPSPRDLSTSRMPSSA